MIDDGPGPICPTLGCHRVKGHEGLHQGTLIRGGGRQKRLIRFGDDRNPFDTQAEMDRKGPSPASQVGPTTKHLMFMRWRMFNRR